MDGDDPFPCQRLGGEAGGQVHSLHGESMLTRLRLKHVQQPRIADRNTCRLGSSCMVPTMAGCMSHSQACTRLPHHPSWYRTRHFYGVLNFSNHDASCETMYDVLHRSSSWASSNGRFTGGLSN